MKRITRRSAVGGIIGLAAAAAATGLGLWETRPRGKTAVRGC